MPVKRIRRPVPARTEPRRTWPPAAPAGVAPAGETAAPPSPARPPGSARERVEATVSKSVELGYKVIDEYLQQGRQTAQRLNAGTLTAEAMATEAQDLGARVARYASDFFGAWMELLELAAAGRAAKADAPARAATSPDAAAPAPPEHGGPDGERSASRLEVHLETGRPVRLELFLHADRMQGPLRAHALRSADARHGRLDAVACAVDGHSPLVRIRVPGEQRPGSYEGLLIDGATNRPVGRVRVTIEKAPPRARASHASPARKPST